MNNVIVKYNDCRKPQRDIRSITGSNSFGSIIYKRVALSKRMQNSFEDFENVSCFLLEDGNMTDYERQSKDSILLVYSDFFVKDKEALSVIVTKASYAKENYKVVCNGRIAGVIFPGVRAYEENMGDDYDAYPSIECDCFIDLSDILEFKKFITGGFESRFFNALTGDEHTVIKHSNNIQKLKKEYELYYLLPEDMKQWFVRPFDYKQEGEKASYKMKRYNMTDLAIRYVHGAIGVEEFEDIMKDLFYFISHRKVKNVSEEEYKNATNELYVNKVRERIESLKSHEKYSLIANYISCSTKYDSIDDLVNEYIEIYNKISASKKFMSVLAVGHGDLCFSNILYSHDVALTMLIDPKGALSEDEMYMNPYYDIAKLSHSVCGGYDFFNSDLYELTIDKDMCCKIELPTNNSEYVAIFKKYLSENAIDYKLIRLYEASLFISMLPLHMDNPRKVFAFILNAISILEELNAN